MTHPRLFRTLGPRGVANSSDGTTYVAKHIVEGEEGEQDV
jgi:hypothetical protein